MSAPSSVGNAVTNAPIFGPSRRRRRAKTKPRTVNGMTTARAERGRLMREGSSFALQTAWMTTAGMIVKKSILDKGLESVSESTPARLRMKPRKNIARPNNAVS
ncbi:Uncharacterised protein [uncultured archaeon]|nr:Uncharacterised protein [uncultured archaeon]